MPLSFSRVRRLLSATVLGTVLAVAALSVTGTASAEAATGTTAAGASAPTRSMWVWNQPAARTLVALAQSRGITELFVSVPNNLPASTRLTWVKSLSKLATPVGIRLQALGGDPGWVDDPAAAVAWQGAALSTGLFSGVHVDIEPWQHPAWGTDQARLVAGYLSTLERMKSAASVPLEADVSFWMWTLGTAGGTPLDAAVLQRVDAVTIMSYRNTVTGPDSITDVGAATLAAAAAAGRPARLAVETNYLGSDAVAAKQTFAGSTEAALNAALTQVDAAEAGSAAYAGLAVQDYAGYDALR